MPASPRITAAVANTMLDAGIGSVANSGKLRVYDGTQPASGGGTITTQTLLLEFTMNSDAFPGASGGVLTANGIAAVAAVASGEASWYRLVKSDGTTCLIDGAVGETESPDNPDLVIDNATITQNDVVAVVSYTITMPLA